jgi:hypothetical protein
VGSGEKFCINHVVIGTQAGFFRSLKDKGREYKDCDEKS